MEAITPQMYGAKGDGKTDDTAAFQKAVDSGYDVYVPTANGETYLITRTINITKSSCKRVFSEPVPKRGNSGIIIFDVNGITADPKTISLFNVRMQLLTISGLRVVSKVVNDHRAGIFINAMDASVCDYDIKIIDCSIFKFYKVACFTGRGFEMLNSHAGSCQYLVELYWKDENDTNKNHPAAYDQRGIAIKNCRLHDTVSGFITVKSGHAYGLHFQGNTIDNGKGYLVKAYEQAYDWNISGNVIQGICGTFDAFEFKKGMRNCVISGNVFTADIGYWVNRQETVASWIRSAGNTISCVVGNNVFKNSDNGFMYFTNIEGTAITGNAISNKTESSAPIITVSGKCLKNTIVGNAVSTVGSSTLLSKTLPKNNTIMGNYPP